MADLARWILSQMTIALHFEHQLDANAPAISPTSLVQAMGDSRVASRNTIHGFLMEMRRYAFVTPIESADRRQRAVRATEMSEGLIRRYFDIHLRALDAVDGGERYALSCSHPGLLRRAQPAFARLLLNQHGWHSPAANIARFVRSDSGSSVLHDLATGIPPLEDEDATPIWIGKVSPSAFSQRYRISRTHAARLLGVAREAGLIGWANADNRGQCWVAPELIRAYRHWQALKLAAVSQAFHQACQSISAAPPSANNDAAEQGAH